jgi:isoleucyl-tRNA synthetase
MPGTYKDVGDTSVVACRASPSPSKGGVYESPTITRLFDAAGPEGFYFLAWTTTPWTLPSNLGLAVGPNIDYILVRSFNPYTHFPVNVILAKKLFGKYFHYVDGTGNLSNEYTGLISRQWDDDPAHLEKGRIFNWEVLESFKGSQIEGCHYEQLLPYEANKTDNPNAFKVLLGDFVTTEDGTGIVHTAPAFGADDFRVGKKYDIGILTMVDKQGKFVDGLGEFSNRYVKDYKDEKNYVDVNVDIAVKLKKENRAFKVEKYEHNYPHCWRTDKPVLYYPLDAWFIKTTAVKDRMVELNKTINWKPKSTGEGRFGNWLRIWWIGT